MNFQVPDIWEVKDVVNKLKNVVLNYTEMESKVHEATNNEPWGASSTLLQEIAQGTYNYQYFNEIMPTIYRRFTEKESRQWRQIYKALVLLEYLIKNGSERVIDDARAHISMVKVMRNFFYIDDKGKDEGINVRNRAKEIVELLGDTEKIRSERKLAKKNRTKYIGVGSDSLGGRESMRGGMGVSGISKYVGFGNDTFGSGGNRGISFNGDALTFEGEVNPYPRQTSVGKYDIDDDDEEEVDDFGPEVSASQTKSHHADNNKSNDDDWGDFEFGGVAQSSTTSSNQQQNVLDDDFSDFQVASTSQTTTSQSSKQPDLFDLLNDDNHGTTHTATPGSTHSLSAFETKQPMTPRTLAATVSPPPPAPPQASSNPEPVPATTGIWAQASGFVALDSLGKKTNLNTPTIGPSMNTLKNTNIQADWNNWATNNPQQPQTPKKSTAFDDLLSL